jgi:hypothetical protein
MSADLQYRFQPKFACSDSRMSTAGSAVRLPSPGMYAEPKVRAETTRRSKPGTARRSLPSLGRYLRVQDITSAYRHQIEETVAVTTPAAVTSPLGCIRRGAIRLNSLMVTSRGAVLAQLTIDLHRRLFWDGSARLFVKVRGQEISITSDSWLVRRFGNLDQVQRQYEQLIRAYLRETFNAEALQEIFA